MRSPFCVLSVLGDLLDDGEVRFIEAVQTLEIAKQRIEALAESKPGEFVIYNEETGERFSVIAGVGRRVPHPFSFARKRLGNSLPSHPTANPGASHPIEDPDPIGTRSEQPVGRAKKER